MRKKVMPILFATLTLDLIGIGMIFPIIPIIFTDPTSPSFLLHGYSRESQLFIAGAITAIASIAQFFAAPILGELSDVYGRKKLLVIGVGCLALAQVIFGFGIETASLTLLFGSRLFAGLASANLSIAQASIADITEPEHRARNFGMIGAAFGIGFIIGPLLGGLIAGVMHNPAAPFWFAAFLGILNLIFVSIFLPETHLRPRAEHNFTIFKGIHNIGAALEDGEVRPLYIANFLYIAGFAFITSFIGIYLTGRFALSEASIGTFYAVVGMWVVATQVFVLPWFTKRYNERQIIHRAMPVVAVMAAAQPLLPNVLMEYVASPFLAVPHGLVTANMMALVSRSVSAEKQGAALGINSSIQALAQGSVPLIAGTVAALGGIAAPFYASALCTIASLIIIHGVFGKRAFHRKKPFVTQ